MNKYQISMKNYIVDYQGDGNPLEDIKSRCSFVEHTHPVDVVNVEGQHKGDDILFENINIRFGVFNVPSKLGPELLIS